MTTPTINTVYAILTDAYKDAGLRQEGDELTPEQLAEGMRRLRALMLFFQTKGLKLWTQSDQSVTLVAAQNQYTIYPTGSVNITKPMRVLQGYYLFTSTNVRRPIYPISQDEFMRLGQAGILSANQGTISQYLVEKLYDRLRVTFWLCPDTTEAANGTAHLLLQTQITVPTELDEQLQFPDEWTLALRWGLADDLATGQPEVIMARCAQKAEYYRQALDDWDVEDASTQFAPDMRARANVRNFR